MISSTLIDLFDLIDLLNLMNTLDLIDLLDLKTTSHLDAISDKLQLEKPGKRKGLRP